MSALEALLEDQAREQFYRVYTADMLWMTARVLYGKDFTMRPYSELTSQSKRETDTRTEAEITNDLILRLRGEAHETI